MKSPAVLRRSPTSAAIRAAVAVMLGLGAALAGEGPAPAHFSEPQIIEMSGRLIAREKNLVGIDVTDEELSALVKGFRAGVSDRPSPYDLRTIYPDIERVARARREEITRRIEQRNEADARKFFDTLKNNTNVVALANGVCLEVLAPGAG